MTDKTNEGDRALQDNPSRHNRDVTAMNSKHRNNRQRHSKRNDKDENADDGMNKAKDKPKQYRIRVRKPAAPEAATESSRLEGQALCEGVSLNLGREAESKAKVTPSEDALKTNKKKHKNKKKKKLAIPVTEAIESIFGPQAKCDNLGPGPENPGAGDIAATPTVPNKAAEQTQPDKPIVPQRKLQKTRASPCRPRGPAKATELVNKQEQFMQWPETTSGDVCPPQQPATATSAPEKTNKKRLSHRSHARVEHRTTASQEHVDIPIPTPPREPSRAHHAFQLLVNEARPFFNSRRKYRPALAGLSANTQPWEPETPEHDLPEKKTCPASGLKFTIMRHSEPPRMRTSFLSLPRELRDMIYEFSIDLTGITTNIASALKNFHAGMRKIDASRETQKVIRLFDRLHKRHGNLHCPTILLINRQIHHEASLILLKRDIIFENPPSNNDHVFPFDSMVSSGLIRKVRSLIISMPMKQHTDATMLGEIQMGNNWYDPLDLDANESLDLAATWSNFLDDLIAMLWVRGEKVQTLVFEIHGGKKGDRRHVLRADQRTLSALDKSVKGCVKTRNLQHFLAFLQFAEVVEGY